VSQGIGVVSTHSAKRRLRKRSSSVHTEHVAASVGSALHTRRKSEVHPSLPSNFGFERRGWEKQSVARPQAPDDGRSYPADTSRTNLGSPFEVAAFKPQGLYPNSILR
jgi:hypothetical protein